MIKNKNKLTMDFSSDVLYKIFAITPTEDQLWQLFDVRIEKLRAFELNNINIFRASMEGLSFYAFSTAPSLITMIIMIILKSVIFVIYSEDLSLDSKSTAICIIGYLAIYLIAFTIKYLNFKAHLNQFITNNKLMLNNKYFSCFISDLNNLVVTFDNEGKIINKNKMFET